MTSSDQEKLSENFYDQLDNDSFLGNWFEDEDNLPVVAIAPELLYDDDNVIDERELEDADKVVEEPHVPSLLQKQRLANLDEVTNHENIDSIPPQEHVPFGILIRANRT